MYRVFGPKDLRADHVGHPVHEKRGGHGGAFCATGDVGRYERPGKEHAEYEGFLTRVVTISTTTNRSTGATLLEMPQKITSSETNGKNVSPGTRI
jgi:hypothetical protein